MAFNMKRPIIKGTESHKASIAKAKADAVVTPYSPHSSSVLSGTETYAGSNVPHAIDYSLDFPDLKLKKKKKKKGKKVEGCMDKEATNYNANASEPCDDCCKYEEEETKVDPDDAEDEFEIAGEDDEGSSGSGDYTETKEYKNFVRRQEEQNIKDAEELKRREAEASKARQSQVTPIKPITDLEQIPTSTEESIQKPSKIPKSKERLDADKNPKYQVGKATYDIEGTKTSIGGFTTSPGYNYDVNNDLWTYNGIPIRESEVSSEAHTAIMSEVVKVQQQQSTSTPSSQNTLIEETTPKIVTPPTTTEQSWNVRSKLRRLDKKWENAGPSVRKNMLNEGYTPKEQRKGDSMAKKRDDRIFKNAKSNGVLRSNMRKSGYIPPNER